MTRKDLEEILRYNRSLIREPGVYIEEDRSEPGTWMVVRYHSHGWSTLFRGTRDECNKYARSAR